MAEQNVEPRAAQSSAPSPLESDRPADDAADLALVSALVARAGLSLSAREIADLVKDHRQDRAHFERMRAMLEPEDETAHTVQAARVMRASGAGRAAASGEQPPSAARPEAGP